MAYKIYTASLLKEGLVAYLSIRDGETSWTTDVNRATSTETVEETALVKAAERSEQENIVIGAYAVDVTREGDHLIPTENRERIRAGGPTITLPASGNISQSAQVAA
jgi:hypothetical protein